jgi:hypothetical protein
MLSKVGGKTKQKTKFLLAASARFSSVENQVSYSCIHIFELSQIFSSSRKLRETASVASSQLAHLIGMKILSEQSEMKHRMLWKVGKE